MKFLCHRKCYVIKGLSLITLYILKHYMMYKFQKSGSPKCNV